MVGEHQIEGARAPWSSIIFGAYINWGTLNYFCRGPFKLVGKNEIEGAWTPRINIIVNYCCTRVLLYAKMLTETETEETIVFFVTFLSLVAFQLGRGGQAPWAPLATPMQ